MIVRVDGHTVDRSKLRKRVRARSGNESSAEQKRRRPDGNAVGDTSFGLRRRHGDQLTLRRRRRRQFHYSKGRGSSTPCIWGAWRRDVFHRVGTFDKEFVRNQDDEFNYRLREQGGTSSSTRASSRGTTRGAARLCGGSTSGTGSGRCSCCASIRARCTSVISFLRPSPRRCCSPRRWRRSSASTGSSLRRRWACTRPAIVIASLWAGRKGGLPRQLPAPATRVRNPPPRLRDRLSGGRRPLRRRLFRQVRPPAGPLRATCALSSTQIGPSDPSQAVNESRCRG